MSLREQLRERVSSNQVLEIIKEKGQFGILSSERPERTPEENEQAFRDLKEDLQNRGLNFIEGKGVFKGQSEPSLFVPLIKKRTTLELGRKYDQEAVLWSRENDSEVLSIDKDGNETVIGTEIKKGRHGDSYSEFGNTTFTIV